MRIGEIIEQEGRKVFEIDCGLAVEDAINLMTDKETSALIVIEGGRTAGIFTERDVLLTYVKFGHKPFGKIILKNAMTNKLIVAKPEDEIEALISLMIQVDIRHLPVVENGKIIALLYICDLLQHQVGTLSADLHYLEEYVSDLHEADHN